MGFTVEGYHDLTQLLREPPEWRDELRRLLLSDELLALPEIVRELAKAQQRTEERLDALVEAQQHFEERLSRLETTVQRLVEQISALSEEVSALAKGQQRLTDTVGGMKGRMLEITYRDLGQVLTLDGSYVVSRS